MNGTEALVFTFVAVLVAALLAFCAVGWLKDSVDLKKARKRFQDECIFRNSAESRLAAVRLQLRGKDRVIGDKIREIVAMRDTIDAFDGGAEGIHRLTSEIMLLRELYQAALVPCTPCRASYLYDADSEVRKILDRIRKELPHIGAKPATNQRPTSDQPATVSVSGQITMTQEKIGN